MNYFDDENKILEWFRETFTQQVLFPVESEEAEELYLSLQDDEKYADWINSSGKGDPPPDFYNPNLKMMMDVMRIDDHGHITPKGKFINPVNMKESKLRREIHKSGFMDMFPNVQEVIINAVTDLPQNEDHNYKFYLENFKRTIEKHIGSISLYQKNHPGYKIVFFVFDESGGYVLAENLLQAQKQIHEREMTYCYPYLSFLDKRFISVFADSAIDYVIWYSPFKHIESDMPELPEVCIYEVGKIKMEDFIEYPEELIMSTEA